MQNRYTAVFQKRGRWYVAYVEEIPGVNTQGRTLKEARENLHEALDLILAANRELAGRHETGAKVRPLGCLFSGGKEQTSRRWLVGESCSREFIRASR